MMFSINIKDGAKTKPQSSPVQKWSNYEPNPCHSKHLAWFIIVWCGSITAYHNPLFLNQPPEEQVVAVLLTWMACCHV